MEMNKKKTQAHDNIQKIKKELMNEYAAHLDEIFAKDTFEMTFDEREKLISGKFAEESTKVIEKHLEKDPQGVCDDNIPSETCLCPCGTIAILCKTEEGLPKIFEREMQTKNGPLKIKEYGYYCPKDRKIFFPSQENA
jgi:uncharacterized protein YqkB